jgi:hypothetical protein
MQRHPLQHSLALLESECEGSARAALPERVQRWLRQSANLGFFAGLEGVPKPSAT